MTLLFAPAAAAAVPTRHVGGFVFGAIATRILTAVRSADVAAGGLAQAGASP
jgi:hypothetical protein